MDYEKIIRRNLIALGYEPRQVDAMTKTLLADVEFLTRKGQTLSDDYFDFEKKSLAIAKALNIDHELVLQAAAHHHLLLIQDPETIEKNAKTAARLLGISFSKYVDGAIQRTPSILSQPGQTIHQNAKAAAKLLKISLRKYVDLLFTDKQEQMLAHPGDAIKKNIDDTSKLLGVTKGTYIKAAARRITILGYAPQTLQSKVEKISELFGVNRKAATKASMSTPALMTLNVERMHQNVGRMAELLGIDTHLLGHKLITQGPTGLYQDPDTVNARVEKVVELTGMEKEKYTALIMKKVNLLWRSPEAVAHNLQLLKLFNQKGILKRDVEEFYTSSPDILAVSPTNFHLRYLYAQATEITGATAFMLLRTPRRSIEEKFAAMLGHNPEQKTVTRPVKLGDDQPWEEKRHVAMVGLIRRGVLSTYEYKPKLP